MLTDIDDTLTLHGRMPAEAYASLEALRTLGLMVVPITGRPPAGATTSPACGRSMAVIGENGAFYFRYDSERKKMRRVYAQSAEERRPIWTGCGRSRIT